MTTEPMKLEEAKLREILAGCEGVTPGPWRFSGTRMGGDASITTDLELIASVRPKSFRAFDPDGDAKRDAIADHIARLDPETVASIVTELLELRTLTAIRPDTGDLVSRLQHARGVLLWTDANGVHVTSAEVVDAALNAAIDFISRLSTAPVALPRELDRKKLEALAALWGYTIEETAGSYAVLIDLLAPTPSPQTSPATEGEVVRLSELHRHTHDIATENLSRAIKAEAERDKLREALSEIAQDRAHSDHWLQERAREALSLKETAP